MELDTGSQEIERFENPIHIKKNFKESRGFLLKESEDFNFYVDPASYLLDSKNDLSLPYSEETLSLFCLQNHMHSVLEYFLNSYNLLNEYTASYNEFPIYAIGLQKIIPLAKRLRDDHNFKFDRLLEVSSSVKQLDTVISDTMVSSILVAFYTDFEENLKQITDMDTAEREIKNIKSFQGDEYLSSDFDYRNAVAKISKIVDDELASYLRGFYLHGSLSTLDYIKGCSDCDTMAIIKEGVLKDPDKLSELREKLFRLWPLFYGVDKLQHHGVYVITEQDMNFFPQTYFPFILFNYSTTLFQSTDKLTFYERDSILERKNSFWDMMHYFRRWFISDNYPQDVYTLKQYLQVLLLMPTIYFQLGGQFNYKKFTFDMIRKEADAEYLEILEKASLMRKENTYEGFLQNVNSVQYLAKVIKRVPNKFLISKFREATRVKIDNDQIAKLVGQDMTYRAFSLTDALLEKKWDELNKW